MVQQQPGLPNGVFSYRKSQFGYIFEGLGMETDAIFIDIANVFTVTWYILWQFGIFCDHFGIFFHVLVCCTKKNLATLAETQTDPRKQSWHGCCSATE
jgi:hypothetical protein